MLLKLAYIATYADKIGNYEFANETTQLLKNAQVFDALRTLLDPAHSGLDRSSGWWKRLLKGWRRGKMDKSFGLALAIKAELNQINDKINESVAPIKDFQEQMSTFYDKVRAGNTDVNAGNLSQELKTLQRGLRDVLNRVSDNKLKTALNLRQRLQEQLVKAIEKLRGIDDEQKEFLIETVLMGKKPAQQQEQLPGETQPSEDASKTITTNDLPNMRHWLKKQNIELMPYKAHAKTVRGARQFKDFMEKYGFHPKAVADYFDNNAAAQTEGFERFSAEDPAALRRKMPTDEKGKPTGPYPGIFWEMLRRAHQVQETDLKYAEEEGIDTKEKTKEPIEAKPVPQATKINPEETPQQRAAKRRAEALKRIDEEQYTAMSHSPVQNTEEPTKKEEEQFLGPGLSTIEEEKLRKEISPELNQRILNMEQKRIRQRMEQVLERSEKLKERAEARKAKKKEQVEPQAVVPPLDPAPNPPRVSAPPKPKAPSKRSNFRFEKQINRFGRIRALKNITATYESPEERMERISEEGYEFGGEDPQNIGKVKCLECNQMVEPNELHSYLNSTFGNEEDQNPPHMPIVEEDVYEIDSEDRERFNDNKEYDPTQMMLDEYGDVQSKDTNEDLELELRAKLKRLRRQIEAFEIAGDKSEKGKQATDSLYKEMANLSGQLEILEENRDE